MNKLLVIVLLFLVSSSYAVKMHRAIVLEHKSMIDGRDDKGHAVNGHIKEIKKDDFRFKSSNKHDRNNQRKLTGHVKRQQ